MQALKLEVRGQGGQVGHPGKEQSGRAIGGDLFAPSSGLRLYQGEDLLVQYATPCNALCSEAQGGEKANQRTAD